MFRILVVEDDESTRLLMCEVLRQAGYEPCPARDGVVFHQIYRGECSDQQLYKKISDTLTMLRTGRDAE